MNSSRHRRCRTSAQLPGFASPESQLVAAVTVRCVEIDQLEAKSISYVTKHVSGRRVLVRKASEPISDVVAKAHPTSAGLAVVSRGRYRVAERDDMLGQSVSDIGRLD